MIFDIIVLVVVLASTLFAFFRGFIREVLTIFGVIGGALAAIYMGPILSPVVNGWIGSEVEEGEESKRLLGILPYEMVADILSYGVIFIIFVILLSVISHFLANWARVMGLGFFDRLLGVLFGVVRAVVLLALLYLPVYLLMDKEEVEQYSWLTSSKSRPYIEKSSAWISQFMPKASEKDMEAVKKEATSMATQAVKKVQEIKGRSEDEAIEKNVAKEAAGYEEQQRDSLDKLFEDATDE